MPLDNSIHMYPEIWEPHNPIICRPLKCFCPYHNEMAYCMWSNSRDNYFIENKRDMGL